MSERKADLPEVPFEGDKQPGLVGDLLKRAVLTGVGALFMTEEGIRNAVGEMKLPKDVLAFLVSQADRTRTDVARVVTAELRRFLESETLRREVWKLLTGITLEVNATIQLKPTGEPGFKATIKRGGEEKERAAEPKQASVPAPQAPGAPPAPAPGDSGAP
jgi:hypothetical protein